MAEAKSITILSEKSHGSSACQDLPSFLGHPARETGAALNTLAETHGIGFDELEVRTNLPCPTHHTAIQWSYVIGKPILAGIGNQTGRIYSNHQSCKLQGWCA